jgi:O-antigen/teichoic acid export membrane protein
MTPTLGKRRLTQWVRSDALFRNSFGLITTTVLTGALGYLFWIIVAHEFPTREVGVAAALISAVTIASILGTAGLGAALIENLPLCRDDEHWNRTLNGAVLGGSIGGAFVGLATALILPALSPTFADLRNPPLLVTFVVASAIWTASSVLDNVFISERASSGLVIRNTACSLLKLPLLVVPIALTAPTASSVFLVWLAAALASLAFGVFVLVPRRRPSYRFRLDGTLRQLRAMRHTLVGHHLISVGSIIPTWLMPVMVAVRLSAQDTAYFFLTWMMTGLFFMVSPAVAASVFVEGAYDPKTVMAAARRSLRLIAILLAVPTLVFVLAGRQILEVFGPGYPSHGYALLVVFVASAVPDAITNVSVAVMRVTNRLRQAAVLNMGMTIIALVGAWFLIGSMGITGAGVAWLIAQTIGACFVLVLYRRASGGRRPFASSRNDHETRGREPTQSHNRG